MARNKTPVVEQNFVGGLITEVHELALPPNACTLTENCEHESTGRVSRRLGFDYENPYTLREDLPAQDRVISGYTWHNVEGDGSLTIRVQQVGPILYFWLAYGNQSISENPTAGTIDLTTYQASVDVEPGLNECSYASANGRLIVCHPECEPFYVTYDSTTDTLTDTQLTIQIRDRVGLDSGLSAVTTRPTASKAGLSDEHYYNLLNQGWGEDSETHLDAWDTARSDMPSNADVWWFYRGTTNAFDTSTIGNESIGNTPAPKGHFILNIHNEDRDTASGISGIPAVTTGDKRVSKVAYFHNRLFYGGIQYAGRNSYIYVTRIIENDDDLGECYQEQDPTSEELNILTDADGGIIPILGMENVVKLWSLNNAVLVFASNGIWAISGSEGIGYRPTDFTVRKISSVSALTSHSFIDINGYPLWWNADGIYQLTVAEGGGFNIEAVTDKTIKAYYQAIPATSRKYAKGTYDPIEKKAYWVYTSTDEGTIEGIHNYDRVLVLNALTGAFYIWKPATGNVKIHDVFSVRTDGGNITLAPVTTSENFELQSFTGEVITTPSSSAGLQEPVVRYFVSQASDTDSTKADYVFGYPYRVDYTDWVQFDLVGQDYTSKVRAGYHLEGGLLSYFQSNYVHVFLEGNDNNTGCLLRGLWDWTNSADSNRWTAQQQLYNINRANRDVNYRKVKLRGKGKALQLEFESETGKPFTILGWSVDTSRNEGP